MRYKVQHDYASSLGRLVAGDEVDLTEAEAEAFNADSPGVLKPLPLKTATKRATKAAPKDRQVKASKDRGE